MVKTISGSHEGGDEEGEAKAVLGVGSGCKGEEELLGDCVGF